MPITKIVKNKEVKIDKLKPYDNNPRVHTDEDIENLAAYMSSLESDDMNGFINQVVTDEKGMILSGHKRVMAAKKLGYEKVDCRIVHGLTDNEKKAYVIADNKHTMVSSWDNDILKMELHEIEHDIDLQTLGFDDIELKHFDIGIEEIPEVEPTINESSESGSSDSNDSQQGMKDNHELNPDDFGNFKHTCPRCGFGWDKDND